MSYEAPTYDVLERRDGYEIRRYDSYLVAETVVPGTFESSGNQAFRRLAGFIFGDNSESKKMAMTVPVTREAAANGYSYRFVMERAYSEDTLPAPNDSRVAVVRVPESVYAVARYRGSTSERRYKRAERELLGALTRDGVEPAGQPLAAVYNGPFTPAPLRHNEVLVPVEW